MGLSPMMQHYIKVKEENKDCIVFYRLGDFYEMFFDDAVKASEILDLTLTGKDCGLSERAPMCGVPYHAADLYISKLVNAGEKVAICEQMTPAGGKELVKREVIKVITAGTVINDQLIDEKTNNFICSVYITKNEASIAWTDITTGEFFTKEFTDLDLEELFNSLVKISPAQIISNNYAGEIIENSPLFKCGILPKPERFRDSEFNLNIATKVLEAQFNVISLSSFNLSNDDSSICSSGALVSYLKETQKNLLLNINSLKKISENDVLMLDINAVRNLELVKTLRDGKRYGTLLWLLDKTKTSMGARKLQSWVLYPLKDIDKINERLNSIESLYNSNVTRESIINTLSDVRDVGRITGRISNGNLLPKDCISLKKSLEVLPNIKFQLLGLNDDNLNNISSKIKDFSSVCELINKSISDEQEEENKDFKFIKKGYNAELDELRDLFLNGKSHISNIEQRERETTGIKNLKIGYNRVFGYYIEVTNSFKDKIPYHYIRRQTLAGAERFITEELKDLEIKILTAEDSANTLELKLFNEIKDKLSESIVDFKECSDAIASLDVLLSLASVAKQNGYCKPEMNNNGSLNIIDGRHPVVEAVSKDRFITNDCSLDSNENRTMIITGPNMAGKSTYMRQVALITLMAHIGSFVPCKKAEIPIIDKIFTRIGASDSLISDQSTFMVEMSEMSNILHNATKDSLLILDEIGRGTSTFDGLSIAWAIVEYISKNIKAKTLFATHYHELTELEGIIDGVKNYKISVKEIGGNIIFLRKILRGGTNKSFGIEVAELAGIINPVVIRAKEILKDLNKKDLTKNIENTNENVSENNLSEVERIINDLDINNLSPVQAFQILSDLIEKVKDKNGEN